MGVQSAYALQYAMYRFILSISISPTASPFSPVSSFGRFMWMFMTCFAMVYNDLGSSSLRMDESTYPIPLFVMFVLDDEDHVKSGKDSRLEVDVLFIVVSENSSPMRSQKRTSPGLRPSSYLPHTGLAAAKTLVLELRTVVIPAFAIEMVCCSIAS